MRRRNLECNLERQRGHDLGEQERDRPGDDERKWPMSQEVRTGGDETHRAGHGQRHHEGDEDLRDESGFLG